MNQAGMKLVVVNNAEDAMARFNAHLDWCDEILMVPLYKSTTLMRPFILQQGLIFLVETEY